VDAGAYRKNIQGWANAFFGRSSTAFTLVGVLEYTMQCVAHRFPDFARVDFFFDDGQETEHIRNRFQMGGGFFKQKYPDNTDDKYVSVKDYPGLQAADTLATEFFWHVKKNRSESKAEMESYLVDFIDQTSTDLTYVNESELVRMLRDSGFQLDRS
jgi:hypothetical protein